MTHNMVHLGGYSLCTLKECVFCCFELKMSIRSNWFIMLLFYNLYIFIYFLSSCFNTEGEKVQPPIVMINLSLSPFRSVSFCFYIFNDLQGDCMVRIVMPSWSVDFFFLQVECHSFIDSGRKHKTPRSETKPFTSHSSQNSMNFMCTPRPRQLSPDKENI